MTRRSCSCSISPGDLCRLPWALVMWRHRHRRTNTRRQRGRGPRRHAAMRSTSHNRLGSCNAACGRYRRRHQNGSLGKGAGHPSAELSLGSRGVMNRRTLTDMAEHVTARRRWTFEEVRTAHGPSARRDRTMPAAQIPFEEWNMPHPFPSPQALRRIPGAPWLGGPGADAAALDARPQCAQTGGHVAVANGVA